MKRFSKSWFDAVNSNRLAGEWSLDRGPRMPTMPWICPPLHPLIREFFVRYGSRVELKPGEYLFPTSQVTHFVYVERGLTGRIASTIEGQPSAAAMAYSPAKRLAAGNLNFATRRPAIGRYLALSHAVLYTLPHAQADELLESMPFSFSRRLFVQFEMNNLSDRLGFSVLSLLPALVRTKALFLAWAVYFGQIYEESGRDYIRMPVPGRRKHIEHVVNISSVTMDKISRFLHTEAEYVLDGDFMIFRADFLQDAHEWMRHGDGDNVLYPRPPRVEALLYGAQAGAYN